MSTIEQVKVIDDRYEVVGTIDASDTAVVYRAVDRRLGRTVAVRLLRTAGHDQAGPDQAGPGLLARLDHSGETLVYDGGTYEGRPYLVTELLPGPTDPTLETPLTTTLQLPAMVPDAPSGTRSRHRRRWWAVVLVFVFVVAAASAIGVWRSGDQGPPPADPTTQVSEPTATTTSPPPTSTPAIRPTTTTTRPPETTTTTTGPKGRGGKPGKGGKPHG